MLKCATLIILLFASFGSILAQDEKPTVSEAIYDARFRPFIPRLKRNTDVLVRLPQLLTPFQTSRRSQLYLSVEEVGANSYKILIENVKDCEGANFCFLGAISGELKTEENKDFIDAIIDEGKAVSLANDTKGYYFVGPCGASCVPDKVMWKQEGFYYTVTSAGISLNKMVKVANSMISGSPINL
ncbi:MAG: hypothetical protein ACR2MD_01925 [Aridibacter sp.]